MTTEVDITNRALQSMGTRTTVASLAEQSNEAIQASLVIRALRDELVRMAPWDCARNWVNLQYITSCPGTPENLGPGTSTWQKGIPAPPWAYEYQYPSDCVRAIYCVPNFTTGFATGIPITTAVTGFASIFWNGPPVMFKVGIDQFIPATGVTIASGGTGHAVGDIIFLAPGQYNPNLLPANIPPIGAPAVVQVTTVGGGGVITGVSLVNTFQQLTPPSEIVSGSYFKVQANPIAQGSTSGVGINATFNLTFGAQMDQRVILTNQEFAILCYNKQITDPNVMDSMFIDAWSEILAARLVFQLTGDKALANIKVSTANQIIMEARKADGNEGLTVNDVTPDWIRIRGIAPWGEANWEYSPTMGFAWGPGFATY
jgi:hypothetical protein